MCSYKRKMNQNYNSTITYDVTPETTMRHTKQQNK